MIKGSRFAVIGGGIGGLTVAFALQKLGYKAFVYEGTPSIKPKGTGIVLAPNAFKALAGINIAKDVKAVGRELSNFAIKDVGGEVISNNAPFGSIYSFHRADLHSKLISLLAPDTLLTGKKCMGFINNGEGVQLNFADKSIEDADFVIAADGIHSVFRKTLLPNVRLRYAGYSCWRGIVKNLNHLPSEASETWGLGKRFGIVPLSGGRIYWYATANSAPLMATTDKSPIAELIHHFKDFHHPVVPILEAARNTTVIYSDIYDFKPISRFAFERVVLLGDAAHATTPNLGQGVYGNRRCSYLGYLP